MKRSAETFRRILMDLEASDSELLVADDDLAKQDYYHVQLLFDAGLMTATGNYCFRMTNAGHDYLEAVRDNGVWQKTKATVSETGGAATLEIVKALAVGFLKKKISQHTDIEL